MNSEEERDDTRKGRAQAMKQAADKAQQAQALTHTAPAVANAAKTASDIDVGGAINALQIASGWGGAASGATGLPQ